MKTPFTINKLHLLHGRRLLLGLSLLFASSFAGAADLPYDETADAHAEIKQALASAKTKPVLLVFGANWCPDCRILDATLKTGPSAKLLEQDFKIVKINVGRFDRNTDIALAYDVPLKKGIPAVVIVNDSNEIMFATRSGELANARSMGESGLYQFFVQAIANSRRKL